MTHASAMSPAYLGIDVGTSMVKAAVFDGTGELRAVASRPLPLLHPAPGFVEQDPNVVLTSVQAVLAELIDQTGVRSPEWVAITGQGDGCWLVDADGVPVRSAISWMDGRAAAILQEWSDKGIGDQIFDDNGNVMFPGAPGAVLAWLDRHEPETLDRAATAGYVKDMLLQRLTGLRATDASEASLPFGSLDPSRDYSASVLELTGLTHRAGLLAPIIRPLPTAPLNAAGAELTGLTIGTPVVAGPYDIPACGIGAGLRSAGDGLLIVGTTLACAVLGDRAKPSPPRAGMTITMPDGEHLLRVMAAMVGTACLDWIMSTLLAGFEELETILGQSPPGARGVEVLPYFAPSGERAPFVNPAARGQFSGLSLTSTRADVIRGVCEGLAYAARDCFSAADLTGPAFVCGGGAASREWMRIFASVLGTPLHLARAGEVGARGAVIGAAQTLGVHLDLAGWTAPQETIEPDPALTGLYDDGFARYRAHQELARQMWRS